MMILAFVKLHHVALNIEMFNFIQVGSFTFEWDFYVVAKRFYSLYHV